MVLTLLSIFFQSNLFSLFYIECPGKISFELKERKKERKKGRKEGRKKERKEERKEEGKEENKKR